MDQVEAALNEGGVDAAKEFCRNIEGFASIYYQGLDCSSEGIEMVEVVYGGTKWDVVLTWLQLFIVFNYRLGSNCN